MECAGRGVGITATARYVDSSVERLEVKVRGMTAGVTSLYATAGGCRYSPRAHPASLWPAFDTGPGSRHLPASHDWRSYAAGVRCLRSLVEPLDRRLHVARFASGRPNFGTFPVNALDAESRRASRFQAMGHTAGPVSLPQGEHNATIR